LFVCPSRYDARHRKPRRCVYALNLGETGISPPDSFSFRSSFRFSFRFSFRYCFCFRFRSRSPDKNPPGPGHPASGDIAIATVVIKYFCSELLYHWICLTVYLIDYVYCLFTVCFMLCFMFSQTDCRTELKFRIVMILSQVDLLHILS